MPAEGEREMKNRDKRGRKRKEEGGREDKRPWGQRKGARVCGVLYNCLQGTSFVLVRETESY